MTDDVDDVAHPLRQHVVDDVDADVLVVEQRPRRAQQENDAEQHPLQLEPGVRRGVEELADDGVGGRDEDRDQDQPCKAFARPLRERVDSTAHSQERLQRWSSPRPLLAVLIAPVSDAAAYPAAASMKPVHHSSAEPPSIGSLLIRKGNIGGRGRQPQPPVTLIWRLTLGRLCRRSMMKSWPFGLRPMARSIAARADRRRRRPAAVCANRRHPRGRGRCAACRCR